MLGFLKPYIIRGMVAAARSRGYELTPQWKLEAQALARHLRAVFKSYEVDCVLDVGGNLGQFHDFIREEVSFTGTFISFEPVAKYIEHLNSRARSERNWMVEGYALGSEEKEETINVTKSPGLNSFLAPTSKNLPEYWKEDAISHRETVMIKRLDSVFARLEAQHRFSRPYLKIDTQGFDLEVIRGAGQYVSKFCALQTEASVQPIYEGQPRYAEVIAALNHFGFDVSGIFPVTNDKNLRLIEFDCVMVRR